MKAISEYLDSEKAAVLSSCLSLALADSVEVNCRTLIVQYLCAAFSSTFEPLCSAFCTSPDPCEGCNLAVSCTFQSMSILLSILRPDLLREPRFCDACETEAQQDPGNRILYQHSFVHSMHMYVAEILLLGSGRYEFGNHFEILLN